MENKYFVFMKLSRTSYDGASIYKEFDDIKSAKLFVTDCETATSDRFDEDKDLKDVLEDEELFQKKSQWLMMNMSAQLTSKLLLVEELLKKSAEKKIVD